ncbi:MAG TPA: condensation domain-containing protein, partial [Pyrinomonadaceae bacterium]
MSATKRDLLEKILRERETTTTGLTIPRHDSEKPLLLSFAQQRLWFLEQLTPGTATYNISRKVVCKGPLSVPALRQSLDEIVGRHASLRTSFRMVEGELVQCVETPTVFPLEKIELYGVSDREHAKEVDRLARHHAQHAFDLAHGPMLRAALLCLSEREHVLLLTIHHAVTDGWSMDLLFRELAILYESFAAGRPSPLPELP